MSVCDDEIAVGLRNKLLFINRRWKDIQDSFQEVEQEETIKENAMNFILVVRIY